MEGSTEDLPDTQTSVASTLEDSVSSARWAEDSTADAGNHADAEDAEGADDADDPNDMEASVADETDLQVFAEDGDSQSRNVPRGELEVVDVSLSGRAQRRLARHARRARIPLVSRALVVEEFVDVEEVASEVHDAERDRLLHMDVSSDEGDVVPTSRASARGTRATRSTQPRVQSAALSVNTGRMVRLRRPARSATSRSSRAQRTQREASPPTAPAERVGNFSWSAVDAAGFEAQPSSSSRPDHLNGESLPGMLDVPLSPDRESPLPDRENTLPESWFLDPEDDAVAAPHFTEPGGMAGFSCIYVEPVRPGMEPRNCGQCHCPFGLGELRLGYTPCGVAADGRQFLPVWVHAFVCTRRARLAIRFDGEAVSFSPAVPLVDRNRLVDELRQLHQSLTSGSRQRTQPRQLCIRPWRYIPSVLQRWPVMHLNEAAPSSEASRSQNSRPGWRLPSPPRRAASHEGDPIADLLDTDVERLESDLGARHVQEVLAQLVSGSLPQLSGETDFDTLPSVPVPVPPMIPNFLAFQNRPEPPEAPAASAAARLLAEVPVFKAEKKSEEPCVVCREDIRVGQMCRRLPCLHLFHRECIDQWIAVKATCPLDNLKLEEMLSQQHSLEVGEEPAPRRRSRSRSPLPRTWSEPEPRSRSSWDVRFRRSRWDPEPNWRFRRRPWDRYWEGHGTATGAPTPGDSSAAAPVTPLPPVPPVPPPPVRPPAFPPPPMPVPGVPVVRPVFPSSLPSGMQPTAPMPSAVPVPSMPSMLPFTVPASMLLHNPNMEHLHPGIGWPPPGPPSG